MDRAPGRGAASGDEGPLGPRVEEVLMLGWKVRRPVLLEGRTGIGKSGIVEQAARRLGIGFRVLDLSLMEPGDLIGMPVVAEGMTRYACPAALPREGSGLLMLEELNRAERHMQQPALQLLSARRLHEYELPPGWSMVAAINPEEPGYEVGTLDAAMRARFLQVRVRAERAAWIEWARARRIHPGVLQVVLRHDRVFDETPPRAWEYASDVLWALGPRAAREERLLRDALGATLSSTWLEALLARRETWDEPAAGVRVHQLLRDYARNRRAQSRIAQALRTGRTDVVETLVHRVECVLLDDGEMSALLARGEFEIASFEALIRDLPGDHARRLQDAFGASSWSASVLEVGPAEVLANYRGSAAEATVNRWMSDRLTWHRGWALATGVQHVLERSTDLLVGARGKEVREGVLALLRQLDAEGVRGLSAALARHGVTT